MYVRTQEGSGQVPTMYSSFAGALGANPLPAKLREFFSRVRERPQDFKKLLLTVTFHPEPLNSKLIVFMKPTFVDEMVMHNLQPVDLLKPLRRIRDAFQKRDAQFRQQIEASLQLRNEMVRVAGELP